MSWARLVGGRLKDPIIGRDVLVGVALGTGLQLFALAIKILERNLGLSTDAAQLSGEMLRTMTSAPTILSQVCFALAIGLLRVTGFYTHDLHPLHSVVAQREMLLDFRVGFAQAGDIRCAPLTFNTRR